MSKTELKEILIARIEGIEDETLMQKILDLVNENGPVYHVSEMQRISIEKGLADIKAGRLKTDDEVQNELDEWLGDE